MSISAIEGIWLLDAYLSRDGDLGECMKFWVTVGDNPEARGGNTNLENSTYVHWGDEVTKHQSNPSKLSSRQGSQD